MFACSLNLGFAFPASCAAAASASAFILATLLVVDARDEILLWLDYKIDGIFVPTICQIVYSLFLVLVCKLDLPS